MLHSARFDQLRITRIHQHHNAGVSSADLKTASCMKMRSRSAPCKSAVLADTVAECRVRVKLHQLLESLFPFSSMPKFMNHMATGKFNFYMLDANYVDLVASLKIFRGCFKVKGFYWPPTLCNLGLLGHTTCCCNGKHLLLTSDLLMCVLPGSDTHMFIGTSAAEMFHLLR